MQRERERERERESILQIAFKRLAAILMQRKVDTMYDKVTSDRKLQVKKLGLWTFTHLLRSIEIQESKEKSQDSITGILNVDRITYSWFV